MNFYFFDSLLDSVFVIDSQHAVLYANEMAGSLLQVSPRNLIRKAPQFDSLFIFAQELASLKNIESLTEASAYQEVGFKMQNGVSGVLQITIQPAGPEENKWIIFARDVTLEQTLHEKYKAELGQKEFLFNELQVAHQKLERYSQNLEETVRQRTLQLSELNNLNQAMLDSLDQGFLVFDKNGNCLDIWSKACLKTIETNPVGKKIWDVLKVPTEKVVRFEEWVNVVFEEAILSYESLIDLGPKKFEHSQKKNIKLDYFPIRDADNKIQQLILVSTDITDLVLAQTKADQERSQVQKILFLVKNKRAFFGLHQDMKRQFSFLETELKKTIPDFGAIFRSLHNLKGAAANFHIMKVSLKCHEAENLLAEIKNPITKINNEKLLQMVREIQNLYFSFLTENENLLGDIKSQKGRKIELFYLELKSIIEKISDKEIKMKLTDDLLTEPIEVLLDQYHDLVSDLANKLGKSVQPLKIVGGEIRVLPERYDSLFKSLVHAIRNSIDHGFEDPEERLTLGKDEKSKIIIQVEVFTRDNLNWLLIKVIDDGRGVDPDNVLSKLLELGLKHYIGDDPFLLIQGIFIPEFTTKNEISEISGRGVGLNSIQVEAQNLEGCCWVESEINVRTAICIEVPIQMVD